MSLEEIPLPLSRDSLTNYLSPQVPAYHTDSQQLFRQVFFNLIPDVILHTRAQDEEQVRDCYDRGNDFYSWFLGPRMIYTSGMIKDINRQETLEELQDNKLTTVCEKLDLQKGDRMLDIGCGWGTLVTFAAKNYGTDVTGGELYKVLLLAVGDRAFPTFPSRAISSLLVA